MSPRQLVELWVLAFNRQDVEALAAMYTDDAVNHQVANEPIEGREAIRAMFARDFHLAPQMHCIVENIFEDRDWGMLEWRDPCGLRGCGFFHFVGERIAFQRGYWDKLTLTRLMTQNSSQ